MNDDYLQNLINEEFTEEEKQAVLTLVRDLIGTGRTLETYREQRNGKNVLMAKVRRM